MASEKNITMRQYNGTDYDTLYPKTKVEQVEGAYTQQQILADSTKRLYGLGNTAVPDDVFSKIVQKAKLFRKLQQYETAGSYEFTVPDGISHIIAFIIGGGASGASESWNNSLSRVGGNSGGFAFFEDDVVSGSIFNVVVGDGGKGASSTSVTTAGGKSGGSSSFGGIVAEGGSCDLRSSVEDNENAGLVLGYVSNGFTKNINNIFLNSGRFKLVSPLIYPLYLMYFLYGENDLLSNFAAGGSTGNSDRQRQEACTFKNGKKSSGGVYSGGTNAVAVTARKGTDFGCGGGSAFVKSDSGLKATSADGMNGVVAVWGY